MVALSDPANRGEVGGTRPETAFEKTRGVSRFRGVRFHGLPDMAGMEAGASIERASFPAATESDGAGLSGRSYGLGRGEAERDELDRPCATRGHAGFAAGDLPLGFFFESFRFRRRASRMAGTFGPKAGMFPKTSLAARAPGSSSKGDCGALSGTLRAAMASEAFPKASRNVFFWRAAERKKPVKEMAPSVSPPKLTGPNSFVPALTRRFVPAGAPEHFVANPPA